jgi:phosphoribosylaminoimidazolecarboxamide formyltransferase/IMP cyclohydrolase
MLAARRALISVSDKNGLEGFARGLTDLGIEIISTGGTLATLRGWEIQAQRVADVTGFPEILDGRVKTLHPKIHGGILARRDLPAHQAQLDEHAIARIDIVAVNLYPFRQTAAAGKPFDEVVEMIDIGGPAMVRAAAKNFGGVAIVVDPDDYPRVLSALREGSGVLPEAMRRELALKAFRHTAEYDTAIARWLGEEAVSIDPGTAYTNRLHLDLDRIMDLRYGENPHQPGAVYALSDGPGALGGFRQLGGKELSWNNLLDADAARKLVAQFEEPAVVIVKHNNPCGVGRGEELVTAYKRALATDPVSAFGSIIALNRPADPAFAEEMAGLFVEVLLAPAFEEAALRRLSEKKNLRILECPVYHPSASDIELRPIQGGFLAQAPDAIPDDPSGWTCPTKRSPTTEERRALDFAWRVCRYVKSNAIVVTNADQTIGIGAGQMSRVDSCRLAVEKAQLPVRGGVAASDAYFPFRDGLDALAAAGITAVIQPGGSKRDDEVIAAADEHGLALLLTGTRHFRH